MSKIKKQAQTFLSSNSSETSFKESFETAKTPVIGLPISLELTKIEERQIEKLLADGFKPGKVPESHVKEHLQQLKDITKQVKSISAQSILLHGERIKKAQELLLNYGEGSFTKWLLLTYGNRQTPYSMLRYYEFYTRAPVASRVFIESAPKKAIYLLASREGSYEKKLQIIQEHAESKQTELLLLIQSEFPTKGTDKKKSVASQSLDLISKACAKLEKTSQYLHGKDRKHLENLMNRLQNIYKVEGTAS